MNPTELIQKANNAKAVLDNPAYQDAYKAVRQMLIDTMLAAKFEDVKGAEECRRCIKLLDSLKSNLDATVQSGKLSKFQLDEVEERRKNPLRNLFR
jgi:hypothetical protein